MQISLSQILEMPNAALLVAQVQSALEEERKERLRFYEIIEENKKMEFINGEIIFHSPVKLRHLTSVSLLITLLKTFVTVHEIGYVASEKMLISLTRNDYEPDICFFGNDKSKEFESNQMQFPAPDFVIEVLSPSTEETDRTTKFNDYAAHNVGEYWIVDAEKETIEQYFLQNGEYELILKAKNGIISSIVLTDFSMQIRAAFDEKINLEELRKLI